MKPTHDPGPSHTPLGAEDIHITRDGGMAYLSIRNVEVALTACEGRVLADAIWDVVIDIEREGK